MNRKVYFLSDAHLGSWAIQHRRTHERRLVSFLNKIKDEAAAIYFLGDIFDFWYEYKHVVPKGFTRFLGKISELTDSGVEVHFFPGNHDLWCKDYFEKECGMIIHREPMLTEIDGKEFYLKLKDNGILVRHFDTPRLRDYNRITIGSAQEMQTFIVTTKRILEEGL